MISLTNFGETTLNGGINNSVTSITVTDGSVFPTTGNFYILIDSEIILVTANSSNVLTVTRAQEGTSAVSHIDTSTVKLTLTKATIETYFGDRIQAGGYASRPSSPHAGTIYYATDMNNLSWHYDGTNWNLNTPVYVPSAHKVDISTWTGVNLSTSVWTTTNGVLTVAAIPGSGGSSYRLYYKSIPTAPYKINAILQTPSASAQFSGAGIGLYDSVSGKLGTLTNYNTGSLQSMSVDKWTNTTTFSSTGTRLQHWGSPFWLQIEDDNTNWYWRVSFDGVNYVTIYQEARNTFFTPNKVCISHDRTESTIPGNEFYQYLAYWEQ